MINQMLLNMLVRQVKNGTVTVDDIKNEDYKQAILEKI